MGKPLAWKSVPWFCAGLALCGHPRAGQVCNLVFDRCPGAFAADTLTVPPEVIWLDAKLPVCPENISVQTGAAASAPSIVFVIDNSASMSKGDVDNSSGGTG